MARSEDSDQERRYYRHHRHHRSRSLSEEADFDRRGSKRHRKTRDESRERSFRSDQYDRSRSEKNERYEVDGRRRRRSRSPREDSHRHRHRHRDRDSRRTSPESRSPLARDSRSRNSTTDVSVRKSGPLPSQEASFQFQSTKGDSTSTTLEDKSEKEKEKPNFAPTGLLAAASNTVTQADGKSIVLKYHEPPEARKPPAKDQWKLFVFKGADIAETIELSLRSCWLIGRELAVVDLPAEHPSISKQHAVIQFRYIEKRNEYGEKTGKVRPYLIDLESANGTMLNKAPLASSRYIELQDKDMIQFGDSTREYVLMLAPKS